MEKEISLVELTHNILFFLKKHFIKYLIVSVLFFVLVFVNLNKQNRIYRESYYIFSDYFSKQELVSLIDMMNNDIKINYHNNHQVFKDVKVFNKIRRITCDTLSPIYSIMEFETLDTTNVNEVKDNVLYFLLNNAYSKKKIKELFIENDFLYKKLNERDIKFKKEIPEKMDKKANLIYNQNDVDVNLYNKISQSKRVLDDIKNKKLIIIGNHLSLKGHKSNFWIVQLSYYVLVLFLITILFGTIDLIKFVKKS